MDSTLKITILSSFTHPQVDVSIRFSFYQRNTKDTSVIIYFYLFLLMKLNVD